MSRGDAFPDVLTSLNIDHDPNVCRYAAENQYAQHVIKGDPLPCVNSKDIVIQCPVQNDFWMQFLRKGQSSIWTASFPRTPFSRGGKMTCLDAPEGRALLFGLPRARIFQPVCICLENVDQFDRHPHKEMTFNIIAWAGYKRAWSQVFNINQFSPSMGWV